MNETENLFELAFHSIDSVCGPIKIEESVKAKPVMAKLLEGVWATPHTVAAAEKLKKLMEHPLSAKEASVRLYSLIGDDSLFDEIDFADGEEDVREIVKRHISENILNRLDDFYVDFDPKAVDILEEIVKMDLTEAHTGPKGGLATVESKEEHNLPKEVDVSIGELGFDGDFIDLDDDEITELLSDYLSDTYGHYHYGFDWKGKEDYGDTLVCYNIKWDTTESLDKHITEEDNSTDLDTYEDRLHHLKDLYDMEPGDLTADEIKELRDAGMLEEKVEVCEKCGKKVCECDNKLKEDLFDLTSNDGINKAKDFIENDEEKEEVQKVVDPAVTDKEDLKKNYVGDVILQCKSCHTLFYKEPEELVKMAEIPEGQDAIYNEEEKCPHCGTAGPFILVGQVANFDVKEEEPAEHSPEVDKEEEKNSSEEEKKEPEVKAEPDKAEADVEKKEAENKEENKVAQRPEREALEKRLDEVDQASFEKLATTFVKNLYENVDRFEMTGGQLDNNKLAIAGNIIFNSGKTRETSFLFEAKTLRGNKINLIGYNEAFTKSKRAFELVGNINNKNLISEGLRYNFLVGNKVAKGSIK